MLCASPVNAHEHSKTREKIPILQLPHQLEEKRDVLIRPHPDLLISALQPSFVNVMSLF